MSENKFEKRGGEGGKGGRERGMKMKRNKTFEFELFNLSSSSTGLVSGRELRSRGSLDISRSSFINIIIMIIFIIIMIGGRLNERREREKKKRKEERKG